MSKKIREVIGFVLLKEITHCKMNGNSFQKDDCLEIQREEGGVALIEQRRVQRPPLFKVLLHNDDYTTMDFVIHVLCCVFGKDAHEARKTMLTVHYKGVGICGIYSHEVAETKVNKVKMLAKSSKYPLVCTMEPD